MAKLKDFNGTLDVWVFVSILDKNRNFSRTHIQGTAFSNLTGSHETKGFAKIIYIVKCLKFVFFGPSPNPQQP